MIDPTLRLEQPARSAADPATGALLLDVVLGHGAEPDPAALLAPAIESARRGRDLPVVVSCVGTDDDPQGLSRQAEVLAAAGAEVFLSNAPPTRTALDLLGLGMSRPTSPLDGVVTVGADLLAEAVEAQAAEVHRVDWRPPKDGTEADLTTLARRATAGGEHPRGPAAMLAVRPPDRRRAGFGGARPGAR